MALSAFFTRFRQGSSDAAFDGAALTLSDSVDLTTYSRMLYVGVAGHVKLTTVGGTTITLKNVPVGILPVRAKRVWAGGTTATDIVALW